MVAAAPPASALAHLARSPASSLLASEFFASERQRYANESLAQAGARSLTLDGAFRLDQYHPLDEIYAFVDALGQRYPRVVRVFSIGRTAEGRPIKALELTNNATEPDFVWLDALTHAREWVTGSTLLYALDRLVAARAQPGQAAHGPLHAKNYILVPVVNPDGYVYTWTTNRMWRKNRSRAGARAPDPKCVGVSRVAGADAHSRPASARHAH